jgi:hypothetical protein
LSDSECYRMDRQVTTHFFGKGSSTLTVSIALGSVDAVSQKPQQADSTGLCKYRYSQCLLPNDGPIVWCGEGRKTRCVHKCRWY